MMLIRPQLSGSLTKLVLVEFLENISDCGKISSRNSVPFIELEDSSATEKADKKQSYRQGDKQVLFNYKKINKITSMHYNLLLRKIKAAKL